MCILIQVMAWCLTTPDHYQHQFSILLLLESCDIHLKGISPEVLSKLVRSFRRCRDSEKRIVIDCNLDDIDLGNYGLLFAADSL